MASYKTYSDMTERTIFKKMFFRLYKVFTNTCSFVWRDCKNGFVNGEQNAAQWFNQTERQEKHKDLEKQENVIFHCIIMSITSRINRRVTLAELCLKPQNRNRSFL